MIHNSYALTLFLRLLSALQLSLNTLLLPSLLFSLVSTSYVYAQGEQHDTIAVDHARINPTVRGMSVTGVYLNISNTSHEAITLVRVTSKISNRIELHEHTMKDGLMKMQQVADGITVPAESSVSLQPGSYHIMVMNLQTVIKPNDNIEMTLYFSNGKEKTITARAITATNKSSTHHH